MHTINFSEYNEIHLRRADHLVSFIKNLNHAMQKTSDYEGAMHQLRCIGFSEEFIQEMAAVASDYKSYHKQRIADEQAANTPEKLYPSIRKERVEQYAKNRELCLAIQQSVDSDLLYEQIRDAVCEELEKTFSSVAFLLSYMDGDVDRMVSALTGWDLEALLAKANIIPDTKGYFPSRDVCMADIAFPLYGKDSLTIEEFKTYLIEVCGVHADTWKMIQSVINFAKVSCKDTEQQIAILLAVLKDYGIPEEIVRMVKL